MGLTLLFKIPKSWVILPISVILHCLTFFSIGQLHLPHHLPCCRMSLPLVDRINPSASPAKTVYVGKSSLKKGSASTVKIWRLHFPLPFLKGCWQSIADKIFSCNNVKIYAICPHACSFHQQTLLQAEEDRSQKVDLHFQINYTKDIMYSAKLNSDLKC